MNKYTIYCTEAQTKKALELDAPIKATFLDIPNKVEHEGCYVEIPTAEQMLGWLETQESITSINIDYYTTDNTWAYWVMFKDDGVRNKQDFNSRKEATLAAIDTALEYLTNNKT